MSRNLLLGAICITFFIFLSNPVEADNKNEKSPILAVDGAWKLVKQKTAPSDCGIVTNYTSSKTSGFIDIERNSDKVSLLIVQHNFSENHSTGWIELQFDGGGPIKINTDSTSGVIMIELKKRMADAFIERFNVSKIMTVQYPSWPEEYPAPIVTPSPAFKKAWGDCIDRH